MKVYRIAKNKYIEDLSGYGAYLYGGRWSTKGTYALYTAVTKSLAYLEFIVHQFDQQTWPSNISIATIEVGQKSPIAPLSDLPHGWNSLNYHISCQQISKEYFDQDILGIQVPSVIVPGEFNIIFNPQHPDFAHLITIKEIEPLHIDDRFSNGRNHR
ncbi:MAG: RES family NAD+ phosphorylase [Marinoscillum sp.]